MSLDVSIVIVNHSGDQLTTECLDSLSQMKPIDGKIHVFVVDNGSPHEYVLPKRLQELKVFDVVLLRSESNIGFTGGNNMGIHAAIERFNSDYVCLLNNDTYVDPLFCTNYCSALSRHPVPVSSAQRFISPKAMSFFQPVMSGHKKAKSSGTQVAVLIGRIWTTFIEESTKLMWVSLQVKRVVILRQAVALSFDAKLWRKLAF